MEIASGVGWSDEVAEIRADVDCSITDLWPYLHTCLRRHRQ